MLLFACWRVSENCCLVLHVFDSMLILGIEIEKKHWEFEKKHEKIEKKKKKRGKTLKNREKILKNRQ